MNEIRVNIPQTPARLKRHDTKNLYNVHKEEFVLFAEQTLVLVKKS